MKRSILILAIMVMAGTVSACNTVEGIGKDMKSAGSTVADAAK